MLKNFFDAISGKEETNDFQEENVTRNNSIIQAKKDTLTPILLKWIKYLKTTDNKDIASWRNQWIDFGASVDESCGLPHTIIFKKNTFDIGTEAIRGELILKDNEVEKCVLETGEVIPGNYVPVKPLSMKEWCRFYNGIASTDEFISKVQRIAERCNKEGCAVVDAEDLLHTPEDKRDIDLEMLFGFRLMMVQQHDSLYCELISPTQYKFTENELVEPEVMEAFDYEPIAGDELVNPEIEDIEK